MRYKNEYRLDRRRGPAPARVSRRTPSPGAALGSRRRPTQQRSRDTVEVILQAAAEVFEKLGYAGATTNKIAERAGVSVGSLYQYFADKDDLLRVLLERHRREVRSVIDAAAAMLSDPRQSLEFGLRYLLEGLLALHTQEPRLSHIFAHVSDVRGGGRGGKNDDDARYVRAMQGILERRPEVRVADARAGAFVVVQSVGLSIRWLGHEAPPTLNAGRFVDEMLTMLLRYLTGRA
jgi:AcrR family transcriptional regulator